MPDIWGIAAILAKLMLYIGVAGSAGLVIIQVVYADLVLSLSRRIRMQAVVLAGVALVASVIGFMLRGAALTGGVDGMYDLDMLGLLWRTPVGDGLIYRVIGAALLIVGVFIPRVGGWVAIAGGTIGLWSFTQIGHVPELELPGVRLLLLMHLLGIAFWVGILGPLRTLSRQSDQLQTAAVLAHRFGKAASVIVPVLIVAGLLMALLLAGNPWALVTTGYGLTLLVKLLLVGVVLTLAAANKLWFVPAMLAGDHKAARHLVRSIEIETAVILVVLATTATLTSVLTLPN